jgi:hypothetical protein
VAALQSTAVPGPALDRHQRLYIDSDTRAS